MKRYICSYNNENTPDFESEVFECWADNEEHAREQCENAYPTAFIAEVYLADEHDEYIYLDIPNSDMQVIVKLDDEGVIVDITDKDNDEPINSTWKMYDEMGLEVKKLQRA